MYAKFKSTYRGALQIYDPSENCTYCAYHSSNKRFIYFDKYTKIDTHWVDQDAEGYLVEKTV